MTLVIAHRGASGQAIENSLSAFRLAVEAGAHGVELDVHASGDGAMVVHHDPDVPAGRIAALPLDRIRSHRLANGEPIPTLLEALIAIGDATDVYIEVKGLASQLDNSLYAAIDRGPAPERCRVHAFDHRIVLRLNAARPSLGSGILCSSYPVNPVPQMRDANATDLWMEQGLVDEALVDAVRGAGGRVIAWTTDAPRRMRELAEIGVDAICTNQPAEARSILG